MDALAEEILELADDRNADPSRSRLQVDTRKWLMSKIAPKRFGERQQLEHVGRLTLAQLVEASISGHPSDRDSRLL